LKQLSWRKIKLTSVAVFRGLIEERVLIGVGLRKHKHVFRGMNAAASFAEWRIFRGMNAAASLKLHLTEDCHVARDAFSAA